MTVFLGILWVILKVIGILFLILLALLAIFLLLPVGVRVCYEAEKCSVAACVGPLRFTVLDGQIKAQAGTPKKQEKKEGSGAQQSSSEATAEEDTKLPAFLQRRVDGIISLAKSDPLALAERALCHGGWFFNRLLHGLKVRHLAVFWPVTGEDAADTALRYGGAITAANNLLLILRRHIKIKADSLQMEADFTAEHAAKKRVAFDVKTTPGILLVIALRMVRRVWTDPALQPAAKAA